MKTVIELHTLRDKIVNHAMFIGFLFGFLSYIITLGRAFKFGFYSGFWVISAVILYFGILVWYRKKVSLNVKIYSMMFVVLMALLSGLLKYGFLVSSKAYIIVIPIFISFILEYKKAIAVLVFYGSVYTCFGILNMTEVLPVSVNANDYILSPAAWSMDISIIMLTALALLIVGKQYSDSILKNQLIIKEKSKDIANREKKYHYLFENSLDAIILFKDQKIIDLNKKALQMFEMNREQGIGMLIDEMAPETQPNGIKSKKRISEWIRIAESEDAGQFEWQLKRYNGELFEASIGVVKVEIDDDRYYQAVIQDITKQKKGQRELDRYRFHLEELVQIRTRELEKANTELKFRNNDLSNQKNELKNTLEKLHETQEKLIETDKMASLGVLTAGVAHEINNPLNFIQAGLYSLRNNLAEVVSPIDSEELLKDNEPVFSAMEEGVHRIAEIVRSLNHFNRKNETSFSNCNIIDIIDNCLRILEHEIKGRIEIEKVHNSGDVYLWAYEGGLHQVFMNVIYNATQAIHETGTIKIISELINQDKNVKVEVVDNGVGICNDVIKNIFDPFYTTKEPGKGTGLGLSIVYNIVSDHKGTVDVDSKIGEGTCLSIVLPVNRINK